jgi:hypothetical protein
LTRRSSFKKKKLFFFQSTVFLGVAWDFGRHILERWVKRRMYVCKLALLTPVIYANTYIVILMYILLVVN